jgi:release factor glutamine methyltransferase
MADAAKAVADLRGAPPTVRAMVNELTRRFQAAGIDTPELDSRLLVCQACNLSREAYILHDGRTLSDFEAAAIDAMAARRLAREPVSRIIGRREFYGREFVISPAVLDPRPDTETLVGAALDLLEDEGIRAARLLDLGTGSGCILLSLLAELADATGIGIDIDPEALKVAQDNARRLDLTERSAFACMDWTTALDGEFDLIVSNPPYIASAEIVSLAPEVRLFDPHRALDGSGDGYSAYKRLARECSRVLRPGGWILLEAGANQAVEILALFDEMGWFAEEKEWDFYRDLAGVNRVVAIKRQSVS